MLCKEKTPATRNQSVNVGYQPKQSPSPLRGEGKDEGVRDSNLSPSSFSSPLKGRRKLGKNSLVP